MNPKFSCLAWLVLAATMLCLSCGDEKGLAGRYQAESKRGQGVVVLEIQDSGKGYWETDLDRVEIRWRVRSGELWLHAKAGGVIRGDIRPEYIVFDFPTLGVLYFKKN